MTNPTPEEIRQFLADCNLRRHGWAQFQAGNRRSAARILTKHENTVNGTGAQGPAFTEQ